MKKLLLGLSALFLISFLKAQTADEIVAKHIEAIGGSDNAAKLNSLTVQSTMEVMGNQANGTATVLNGKGYKSEMEFNGQKIVQVVSDKGGWMINPFAGSSDATALTADQYKGSEDEIYLPDALYNYAQHGAKVSLEGTDKVGDNSAYKIKYTNKDGGEITYYIDSATYNIVKEVRSQEMQGQTVDVNVTYSDYRKTDVGISIPYSRQIDTGQFSMKSTVSKAEVNKDVDPSIFNMPK